MSSEKSEIVVAAVLIALLSYYGSLLTRDAWSLRRLPQAKQAIVASNQNLVFQSEAGIDISGRPVHPLPPPQAERTIVFLLHGASIGIDLDFWRQVESLLPESGGVRLVGYCDGDNCADSVRKNGIRPSFPVIVYGEITDSQALINEDARGYSILRSERWFRSKSVAWRISGSTPQSVVKEALK
jgi:hypothetical protein